MEGSSPDPEIGPPLEHYGMKRTTLIHPCLQDQVPILVLVLNEEPALDVRFVCIYTECL